MSAATDGLLPTGLDVIDRKLGGGVPVGSVAVLSADPASQSELFLYQFAATRPTVYCSTIRAGDTVEGALADLETPLDEVEAIRLDADAPIDHARDVLEDLPEGTNMIVDPVVVLEEGDPVAYRRLLSDLGRRADAADLVVLLHCLRDEHTPARRRDTVHASDVVFELTTEIRGDSVVNRLSVPKFRGGRAMDDVVKLRLTTEIEVDLSRNIV